MSNIDNPEHHRINRKHHAPKSQSIDSEQLRNRPLDDLFNEIRDKIRNLKQRSGA